MGKFVWKREHFSTSYSTYWVLYTALGVCATSSEGLSRQRARALTLEGRRKCFPNRCYTYTAHTYSMWTAIFDYFFFRSLRFCSALCYPPFSLQSVYGRAKRNIFRSRSKRANRACASRGSCKIARKKFTVTSSAAI